MEHLNAIALTMLRPSLLPIQLMRLYRHSGSATAIIEDDGSGEDSAYSFFPKLKEMMTTLPQALRAAEEELSFCKKHNIQVLIPSDEAYPRRLALCEDAPLVLYYCGNADLNTSHIINIVGTRKSSSYGSGIIKNFIRDLRDRCPDTLVVSGLAYGIDICAHRNALESGMKTVGVLAHGLDTVYPALHRETAIEMVSHGGLLSEYPIRTRPEKRNFVQRNRIVAGLSDATVLVESASHGGGLITCDISLGYGREVFAFPGPVNSLSSEGCNNYIRDEKARLITSASDFVRMMEWGNSDILSKAKEKGIERSLFQSLSQEEEAVVNVIRENGEMFVTDIVNRTGMSLSEVNTLLFHLEMNGVVRSLAGGGYSV